MKTGILKFIFWQLHLWQLHTTIYFFQTMGVFETLLINGCLLGFSCSPTIKKCFPKVCAI